jgi:hypothetical protein
MNLFLFEIHSLEREHEAYLQVFQKGIVRIASETAPHGLLDQEN